MPRGLMIRRIIAGCLILLFIAATVYSIAANFNDPLLFVAGALLGMAGLIEPVSIIWDRLGDDLTKPRRKPSADAVRDVNAYLEGRLRQFDSESKLFVELAGDTIIQTTFSSEAHQFEDIQKAVELHQGRFVLIGEPGAGKSTTLRHLMIQAIHEYLDPLKRRNTRLPVWINLGLSGTPINANDLLQFWWDEQAYLPGVPDQYIKQDAAWFFMDGLNEMPLDSREERAKALKAFLEKHPTLPVIVTCRVRDYEDDEKLNLGLPIVRVHELDEGRIQEFITLRGASADLWDKIRSNDALRRMADNPYKLVMLIAVYQARRELPERLDELYGLYVTEAYRTYKDEREKVANTPLLRLTWPKLETRLKRLAFLMIKDGQGTAASVDWARRKIGKRALLDGINLGVLLVDGEDVKFYHQSLHGFFAVDQLTSVLIESTNTYWGAVRANRLFSQIRDLGEAGLPATSALIRAMEQGNRKKAGRQITAFTVWMVAHIRVNRSKLRSSDWQKLLEIMEFAGDSKKLFRANAAITLGNMGGEEVIKALINGLSDSEPLVRLGAANALKMIGSKEAIEALIGGLGDDNWLVRGSVIEALSAIGDADAVPSLIAMLNDNEIMFNIRHADSVAQALRKIGIPEALAAVEQWEREQQDKPS